MVACVSYLYHLLVIVHSSFIFFILTTTHSAGNKIHTRVKVVAAESDTDVYDRPDVPERKNIGSRSRETLIWKLVIFLVSCLAIAAFVLTIRQIATNAPSAGTASSRYECMSYMVDTTPDSTPDSTPGSTPGSTSPLHLFSTPL